MAVTVLIVEDEARSRMLAHDILASQGFDTLEAASAEEGIALALEKLPTLVIMDIRLASMDGLAALQALKTDDRTQQIPVVCVTASAMQEEKEALLAAGFSAYLAKPYRYGELVTVVNEVLRLRA